MYSYIQVLNRNRIVDAFSSLCFFVVDVIVVVAVQEL